MGRYFDGQGKDVTAYVANLEAKVKALSEKPKVKAAEPQLDTARSVEPVGVPKRKTPS